MFLLRTLSSIDITKVVSFRDIVIVTSCDCFLIVIGTSGDIAVVSLRDMKVVSLGDIVIINIVSLGDKKVVFSGTLSSSTSTSFFLRKQWLFLSGTLSLSLPATVSNTTASVLSVLHS